MAYDAFDKWLNVPKLSIFNGKDAFANDTTFDKSMIAYYACLSGYQAKDYAKALAHFDEASNYKKEQDQVYLLKAQVLNEQKDTVKWAEFMRETALKFPDHPSFAQNMLAYYQIKNRTEDALKFADELIAKDPSNKVAYSAKGVALFGQQKFLDAAEFFKKAAELDPTYADAWLNAGLCYYNAAGDATIKLPKNFRSTAYAQGAVKVKDLYRKAEPFFIHYRELKPDDTASWAHRLRFIYQTTDQPEKVKEMDKIIKDNQ
jgi:tetratricopeptide (TPR) repeat protein